MEFKTPSEDELSKQDKINPKNNAILTISSCNDSSDSGNTTESGYFIHRSPPPNSLPSSSSMIPYTNPRYPHNTIMSERLKTFNNWPSHYPQSPENLARAGFFYTGINDLVRCFHCGGGLTSWEAEDNSWVEHAHWFPQCTFLRQNKGDEFIQIVQSMVDQLTEEPNQQENTSDAVGDDATPHNKNSPETKNDIEGLISVRSVKEMGYTIEIIRQAYKEVVHEQKTTDISAVQLMKKVLEIEDRKLNISQITQTESPTADLSTTQKPRQRDVSTKRSSEVLKSVTSSTQSQMSCVQLESTDPTADDINYKDLLMCKVCMEEEVSIVFLPCGHLATCGHCAPSMKRCPICKQHVRGSVKKYLA